MPRVVIKLANLAWLVIVFIGLPAATHAQFANWNIGPASTPKMLVSGGLALGALANFIMAVTRKKPKDRVLWWEWMAIFTALLIVQYGYVNGYLNFNWLKHSLQWIQSKL